MMTCINGAISLRDSRKDGASTMADKVQGCKASTSGL